MKKKNLKGNRQDFEDEFKFSSRKSSTTGAKNKSSKKRFSIYDDFDDEDDEEFLTREKFKKRR